MSYCFASHLMDKKAVRADSQEVSDDDARLKSGFALRLREAMGPMTAAALARAAGLRPQVLDNYFSGSMPGADKAIALARALDVPVEWLVTGEMPAGGSRLMAADEADWIIVPHYRLSEFTEIGKPEPIELVPLRKDWLNRNARTATKLWLTELPTTFEGLGEEGDTILCRDADTHHQEGIYLYFFDGLPIVREVKGPMPGQLAERPAWAWQADEAAGLRLVARILGTIKLRPV